MSGHTEPQALDALNWAESAPTEAASGRTRVLSEAGLAGGTLRPLSRASYPSVSSERKPRIGKHGIVALRVMRAAQIRAIEIRRSAKKVQVLCELQADPHVPGRIRKRRAVAEREVGEVLDEAGAVRTADVTVVEGADTGGRAKTLLPDP